MLNIIYYNILDIMNYKLWITCVLQRKVMSQTEKNVPVW